MGCDKQWLLAYKLNISLFFKINNRTFIIDVQLAAKNLSVISHSLLLAYLPNHCYQQHSPHYKQNKKNLLYNWSEILYAIRCPVISLYNSCISGQSPVISDTCPVLSPKRQTFFAFPSYLSLL